MDRKKLLVFLAATILLGVSAGLLIYFQTRDTNSETSNTLQSSTTTVRPSPPTPAPLVVPECPPSNNQIFELSNVRVEPKDLVNTLNNCQHLTTVRLLNVELTNPLNGQKAYLPKLKEFKWDKVMLRDGFYGDFQDYLGQNLTEPELKSEFLFFDTEQEKSSVQSALSIEIIQLSIRGRTFLSVDRKSGELTLSHMRKISNNILELLIASHPSFKLTNFTVDLITLNMDLVPVENLRILSVRYGKLFSNTSTATLSQFIRRCMRLEELYLHVFDSPQFHSLSTSDLKELMSLRRLTFKYGGSGLISRRFIADPGTVLPQIQYLNLNTDWGLVDPDLISEFPDLFPNLQEFVFESYHSTYDTLLYQALKIGSLKSIQMTRYNVYEADSKDEHRQDMELFLRRAGISADTKDFVLIKNEKQKWIGKSL